MSIFSFFNKVLAGQKSKARKIDGFDVSYRYSGKAVLFDPITMLRDLRYKLESDQISTGELCVGLGEIDEPNLILKERLAPTVVAKFKIEDESLEVERCVKTFETVPCSRYDFFLNQKPLCTFQRIYDYGKTFALSQERISPYVSHKNNLETNFWKNNQNEGLFLEHFGHTQLWVLHSVSDLENIWRKLEV
ncbi:MAG TPA: hypothetical protein VLA71_09165 [Algoriphagus sp.]|nr:hypothetical protein [Algoriphagus sp.]